MEKIQKYILKSTEERTVCPLLTVVTVHSTTCPPVRRALACSLAITGDSLQAIVPLQLRRHYSDHRGCEVSVVTHSHNVSGLFFLDCAKGTLHFRILLGVKALCTLAH